MQQISSLIVLALLASATAGFLEKADELFDSFKVKYHRKYASSEEEAKRRAIFRESMSRVDKNNELNGTPVFGVTKFSDWTAEERKVLRGRKSMGEYKPKNRHVVRDPKDTARWKGKNAKDIVKNGIPSIVNWASEGVVTPVKNQGQCGSCWAFSVAEEIESEWAFQGNYIWEFSPQQVASCTTTCDGCGGGETYLAYEYLEGVLGLGSSWYAPYIQSMYSTCEDAACTETCDDFINYTDMKVYSFYTGPYASLSDYSYATPSCTGTCSDQNTTLLYTNLATYGPVSICVNAGTWDDYTSGVLTQSACGGYSSIALDHCVQLVGYNAAATSPYWLVRNSWATNWGVEGYILLQFPLNTCGLADEATFVSLSNSISDFSG